MRWSPFSLPLCSILRAPLAKYVCKPTMLWIMTPVRPRCRPRAGLEGAIRGPSGLGNRTIARGSCGCVCMGWLTTGPSDRTVETHATRFVVRWLCCGDSRRRVRRVWLLRILRERRARHAPEYRLLSAHTRTPTRPRSVCTGALRLGEWLLWCI